MRSLLNAKGLLQQTLPLLEAIERRSQLSHECRKIEIQLRDDKRLQQPEYKSAPKLYAAWRNKAEATLRKFREEQRQLSLSIERRKNLEELLREARELLLDLEKELVFEPKDNALMNKLAQYFGDEGGL